MHQMAHDQPNYTQCGANTKVYDYVASHRLLLAAGALTAKPSYCTTEIRRWCSVTKIRPRNPTDEVSDGGVAVPTKVPVDDEAGVEVIVVAVMVVEAGPIGDDVAFVIWTMAGS